jgi:hypothetical protein
MELQPTYYVVSGLPLVAADTGLGAVYYLLGLSVGSSSQPMTVMMYWFCGPR